MPEDHETYVGWLQSENETFAAAARINLETRVPTCPGWTLRDLVIHHGSFQAWITGMLLERAQSPVAPVTVALDRDADVLGWYIPIGDRLVATLLEIGPDAAMWDATGQQRSGAWARRQASETSVHRWDAQHAHGRAQPILHAGDYIDEMLTLLVPNLVKVFGAPTPTGTLSLESTDENRVWRAAWDPAAWESGQLEQVHGEADARLIGTTSDLFLALWRRPNAAEVVGNTASLTSWNATITGT